MALIRKTMTEGGAITALCRFGTHHVVAAAEDNTIRVWNIRTGDCEMRLAGHTDRVNALCVVGDGELVSGSEDFTMRRWNLAAGGAVAEIAAGTFTEKSITSLTPMGNTQAIATCHWDSKVFNVDVDDGRFETFNTGSRGGHIESSCAVDADHVAVGTADGEIQVWDVTRPLRTHRLRGGHEEGVSVGAICMLPNGSLASGGEDNKLLLWDMRTRRVLHELEEHTDTVSAVCAVGTQHVASGSRDATIRLWDTATGACVKVITEHTGPITGLCVVDGRLVSASEDGRILVLDPGAGIRTAGFLQMTRRLQELPLNAMARIAAFANVNAANVYGPGGIRRSSSRSSSRKTSSKKTSSSRKTSSKKKTSSSKKKVAANMNALD
jgi:WD40 repeat protein